ncbi:MAG: hypothetical protein U5K69_02010 [Balneolaceae bacterium]|nr:hypothetical protein [Balneolaceae bacterium]
MQNICNKGFGLATMGIGMESSANRKVDLEINFGSVNLELPEVDMLPILSVLPAQVLGFFTSLKYGLQPDAPSASGAISRVVEGVRIYPYEHHS